MFSKILNRFFTILGVIAGLIVFCFFMIGKWIEFDCERAQKTMYKN